MRSIGGRERPRCIGSLSQRVFAIQTIEKTSKDISIHSSYSDIGVLYFVDGDGVSRGAKQPDGRVCCRLLSVSSQTSLSRHFRPFVTGAANRPHGRRQSIEDGTGEPIKLKTLYYSFCSNKHLWFRSASASNSEHGKSSTESQDTRTKERWCRLRSDGCGLSVRFRYREVSWTP